MKTQLFPQRPRVLEAHEVTFLTALQDRDIVIWQAGSEHPVSVCMNTFDPPRTIGFGYSRFQAAFWYLLLFVRDTPYNDNESWCALRGYATRADLEKELPYLKRGLMTQEDYLRRYPRTCAHIMCHSLGYASPLVAARILMDAHRRQQNWCEWLAACYQCDALKCVKQAVGYSYAVFGVKDYRTREDWYSIRDGSEEWKAMPWKPLGKVGRHSHHGYMAEYAQAWALVQEVIQNGQPAGMLAGWF